LKTLLIFPTGRLRPFSFNRFADTVLPRLGALDGRPIRVRFLPDLSADRLRLYSAMPIGEPVHAGTFLRQRRIVLDQSLQTDPRELARILVHEIFHFVWVRLSNQKRLAYEELLRSEFHRRARGELGWSSELRKRALQDPASGRAWREYLCESFCDSAAWLYSGLRKHDEFTLARRHRDRRALWFRESFGAGRIPI
jgi:hypothetical protein